jgi:hypothetical protein
MSTRDQQFAKHAADWLKVCADQMDAKRRLEQAQQSLHECAIRLEDTAEKLAEFVGPNISRKVAIVGAVAILVQHMDRPGGLPDVSVLEAVTLDQNGGSSS